jgi:hypothetical protein
MRDRRTFIFAAAAGLVLTLVAAPLSAAGEHGFDLSVIVDGCEAPEYEHGGRVYIEALRGRSFALRLSNPTSERVAVALSVDGRNVVDAARSSAQAAAKWILHPGQVIEIPGWQVSGEAARKFFFTETRRSYAKWLGDTANVGIIEAVFFREKRRWPMPVEGEIGGASPGLRDEQGARQSSPPDTATAAPRRSTRPRPESDDMAATGIGDKTDFPVRWIEFDEEPHPVARVALRYEYRRELVRLGVLPRSRDALAARERARGFEPRFAPDPWGPR